MYIEKWITSKHQKNVFILTLNCSHIVVSFWLHPSKRRFHANVSYRLTPPSSLPGPVGGIVGPGPELEPPPSKLWRGWTGGGGGGGAGFVWGGFVQSASVRWGRRPGLSAVWGVTAGCHLLCAAAANHFYKQVNGGIASNSLVWLLKSLNTRPTSKKKFLC